MLALWSAWCKRQQYLLQTHSLVSMDTISSKISMSDKRGVRRRDGWRQKGSQTKGKRGNGFGDEMEGGVAHYAEVFLLLSLPETWSFLSSLVNEDVWQNSQCIHVCVTKDEVSWLEMLEITGGKLLLSVFRPSNAQLARSSWQLSYIPSPHTAPCPFYTRLDLTPPLLFFVKLPDGQMERRRKEEEAEEEGGTECR